MTANDMKSDWWPERTAPLLTLFHMADVKDFASVIGHPWALHLLRLIEALDQFVKVPHLESWVKVPVGPWLAHLLRFMINHDGYLYDYCRGMLPKLNELEAGYVATGYDPTIVGWCPVTPRPCSCCGAIGFSGVPLIPGP